MGLEQLFPPLRGKCDASYHVEGNAHFGGRTGAPPNGIPAEPRMGREIRTEASAVAMHFVQMDRISRGRFRAARDILFRDYVELVISRVLGPERTLWFLRECLVKGGTAYYQAAGRYSIIAGTADERRAKEKDENIRMWDKLWKGWKPKLPMEPNAIQLKGPIMDETEYNTHGVGQTRDSKRNTLPVTDSDAVDEDVLEMAADSARQELQPEPPTTAKYGKQTWDLPEL